MPDRVKLPKGVSRRYKNVCQEINERQPPASVARTIAAQLEKDLRKQGKGGAQFLDHMNKYVQPLINEGNLLRNED
ncbi:MAG: hypothetical protein GY796_22390 [Chloroflexi bacterium]|nr:hypothetical protein [Chloroflexota bacterium]